MVYVLKKTTPTRKGLYLQIYQSFYDPNTKSKRNKCFKSLGYVCDLIAKGIADPVTHYKNVVKKMNEELKESKDLQIGEISTSKNAGYFLIKSMFDLLDMDKTIDIVCQTFKTHYKFSDMFRTLCYAQVVNPGSKHKAFEKVIPNIYGVTPYSYDQILDAVACIGYDYHKFVQILNYQKEKIWPTKTDKVYFDCTNYYFEIDIENEFIRKGPSKENRSDPLLGQALMLDSEQIPLDTCFYPGNQSEKPLIRKMIEEMKERNNIVGKVIQVADKGLNCARNIYSAVVEANDGYIFSKSIKGRNLTKEQKEWIFASDNRMNVWNSVRDQSGELKYRYKVMKNISPRGKIDDYTFITYKCKIDPNDTKETEFTVKEKRILTYNPALAKKQRLEITKEVEKLEKLVSSKQILRDNLGDSSKYVNLEAFDIDGKKVKIATSLNEEKIKEDLSLAGYNMIITSEINADPVDICKVYHNLWRTEESFRILKTYLEARPAFLSNENAVYGHFLVCYICLTLIRLLELKIFNDEIPASQLFEFIRGYNVTKANDESYINNATASKTFSLIKQKLGLAKLGNVYLTKRDIDMLLQTDLDI